MAEKKDKSFEEELSDLEEMLETGEVPLDDAIKEFTKAMELSKKCDAKLKKAEEAITKLVNKDGSVEEFKIEE